MKAAIARQIKLRVEPGLKAHVQRYCAAHGCTEQALLRTALEQYLTGTNDRALLMRRLDRISRDVQELSAANVSLGEAFGAFVQMWFGHHPEIPEGRKEEARRDAGRRYRTFVQHVVRTIGDGRTLIGQLTGGGEPRGPLSSEQQVQS